MGSKMDRLVRGFLTSLLLVSANVLATATRGPHPNPIFPTKTYVEINNRLSETLAVHCKSRDNDLGIHVIQPQGQWGFRFQPNVVVETSLFYCSFRWGAGPVRNFDIYVERRDEYRCKNCIWDVTSAGPCLRQRTCYPWRS